MSWLSVTEHVVSRVVAANPGKTNEELRYLCNAEYPFGERAMHPYKVWNTYLNGRFGPSPAKKRADDKKMAKFKEEMRAKGCFPLEGLDGS